MLEVVDNAVPEYLQDFYELAILGKSDEKRIKPLVDFHVKYEKTFSDNNQTPISLVHILKSDHILSEHFSNFYQVVDIACKALTLKLKNVVTGRVYLTTPQNSKNTFFSPHIDLNIEHVVVLYYVNNADGDTVFFDNNGNIFKKIKPVKGRLVVFDGAIYHAAGVPKETHRCVINFDIEVFK
jgi:hypothetical protein